MNAVTSREVANLVRREVQRTYAQVQEFPWSDRERYALWLAQTYYYVRRVTHVLTAAAARTGIDDSELHAHFLRSIVEERDHDALATHDLHELGFQIDSFPEHPLTTAYYQTLVYMVEHEGPAAILGYFLVLEGLAGEQGRDLFEQVARQYGEGATTFLKEHVVLDADHFPAALALLDNLAAHHLGVVRDSAALGAAIYRRMIAAIGTEPLTDRT